jgi:hypothetical protein
MAGIFAPFASTTFIAYSLDSDGPFQE